MQPSVAAATAAGKHEKYVVNDESVEKGSSEQVLN